MANKLTKKVSSIASGEIRRQQQDDPTIQPALVVNDRGNYTYDIVVRGRRIDGVHCILPFDGIYAELTGKEVWVSLGSEILVIGIRYPRDNGVVGALENVRRTYMLEF